VDDEMRDAVAQARVVVVSVGFNDTPWNLFTNPCGAADQSATKIDWSAVTPACIERAKDDYARALDEVFEQIDVRLLTVHNDWVGFEGRTAADVRPSIDADIAFLDAGCWVVEMHGGACVDALRLFNGPNGERDAAPFLADDHTHYSQAGHRALSDALAKLGL
jgi:lysophospholipase L1-like esterase